MFMVDREICVLRDLFLQALLGGTQVFDFTVQYRLKTLKHHFDTPMTTVQIGDLLNADSLGKDDPK